MITDMIPYAGDRRSPSCKISANDEGDGMWARCYRLEYLPPRIGLITANDDFR